MGNQPSHRLEPKNKKKVMDRLRRSLRDSFRKRRDSPEASKPNHWIEDETAVRNGTCHFPVKYLGCVEVFESRGMQVCEEALKLLRTSRRRPIKGILFVTGDGLRVVDDETKGLIVDQTIEKVSFCAPDRGHERGFSYICRDGTTRRWMCHGFLAIKDTGERLSHAVGCAFAVCLERKQKRDKESVMMTFDPKTSTFTRTGSFRQSSLTERMTDPQECKPAVEPPPVKTPAPNPYAIERPHAAPSLLQRQNSFRLNHSGAMSPFKRQLSLRLDELPSTLERQRAMSLGSAADFFQQNGGNKIVTPIPENSPIAERNSEDSISAMCQQLTQDLTFLSTHDTPFVPKTSPISESEPASAPVLSTNPWAPKESASTRAEAWLATLQQQAQPPAVQPQTSAAIPPPRKSSPNFSHLRSQSLGHADMFQNLFDGTSTGNKGPQVSGITARDPFDAEWAALAMRHQPTNNPFARHNSVTEVQM